VITGTHRTRERARGAPAHPRRAAPPDL